VFFPDEELGGRLRLGVEVGDRIDGGDAALPLAGEGLGGERGIFRRILADPRFGFEGRGGSRKSEGAEGLEDKPYKLASLNHATLADELRRGILH